MSWISVPIGVATWCVTPIFYFWNVTLMLVSLSLPIRISHEGICFPSIENSFLCVASFLYPYSCVWYLWFDFTAISIRSLLILLPRWITLEPLVFFLKPLEFPSIGSATCHWVVLGLLSWSHCNFLGVEVEVIISIRLWLDYCPRNSKITLEWK